MSKSLSNNTGHCNGGCSSKSLYLLDSTNINNNGKRTVEEYLTSLQTDTQILDDNTDNDLYVDNISVSFSINAPTAFATIGSICSDVIKIGNIILDNSNNSLQIRDNSMNYITIDSSNNKIIMKQDICINNNVYSLKTLSIGPDIIPLTNQVHEIVTTGIGDALVLEDGIDTQEITILYIGQTAGTDTAILTPDTFINGTTITFNNIGDVVKLHYSDNAYNSGWYILSINGAVVA